MTTNELSPSNPCAKPSRASLWAATAAEVADFRHQFGKLPGDNNVTPRERALRVWMQRQRQKEIDGKLSPEQVATLERIDDQWRSNQVHLAWHNHLAEAREAYVEDANSSKAGSLVARQRARMAAGKLRPEQILALNSAFPQWRDPFKVRWDEHAENLRSYLGEHGTLPTSRAKDPLAYKLGLWLKEQRRLHHLGTLKEDRVARLDESVPGWRGTSQ
mgnify:CR=1 FL=1